ncbi:MAG: Uma2 family endonuclease [Planctomycetes bacterium]|nr:Uma2 family endonuclease [Planctomycetota bacterium]
MPTVSTSSILLSHTTLPVSWTLADLQEYLGGIPLERIRLYPPPGLATEEDALDIQDKGDRLCELVDGVLVVKTMGAYESLLALYLGHLLHDFLEDRGLGIVLGADGPYRLKPGKMRMPDVSFIRWQRLPRRKLPRQRVLDLAPDLAIEILSEGNTEAEMRKKLQEYFEAGVEVVWIIDPEARTAKVWTTPEQFISIPPRGALDGGSVLPGFRLPLRDLFRRVEKES